MDHLKSTNELHKFSLINDDWETGFRNSAILKYLATYFYGYNHHPLLAGLTLGNPWD